VDRASLLHLLRNDLGALVQTVLEKYYRGQIPYGMDAAAFRMHALYLIKDAAEHLLAEDEFWKNNPLG
jgi:hypothetical protein